VDGRTRLAGSSHHPWQIDRQIVRCKFERAKPVRPSHYLCAIGNFAELVLPEVARTLDGLLIRGGDGLRKYVRDMRGMRGK
jgi:hypothetical protein